MPHRALNQHGSGPARNQHGSGPARNQHGSGPARNQHGSGPARNQNGSGQTRYIRDPFSQLPMNDDHLYPAKRGTTPGRLTFSRNRKTGNRGRKEPVCPDEPQTRLRSLAHSLKVPFPTSTPQVPRTPAQKAPQTTPRSCADILLTHNSLFAIFNSPQSEFLSNQSQGKSIQEEVG